MLNFTNLLLNKILFFCFNLLFNKYMLMIILFINIPRFFLNLNQIRSFLQNPAELKTVFCPEIIVSRY